VWSSSILAARQLNLIPFPKLCYYMQKLVMFLETFLTTEFDVLTAMNIFLWVGYLVSRFQTNLEDRN
jgi:hypothetical protein